MKQFIETLKNNKVGAAAIIGGVASIVFGAIKIAKAIKGDNVELEGNTDVDADPEVESVETTDAE